MRISDWSSDVCSSDLADPALYAPQYGGYCAWAVAQGYTASTDPAAWHIEGGKLYLNYSLSVPEDWEEDIPGNIVKGDANWPGQIGRAPRRESVCQSV